MEWSRAGARDDDDDNGEDKCEVDTVSTQAQVGYVGTVAAIIRQP